MKNTGRIEKGLHPIIKDIAFGKNVNKAIDSELKYIVQVDKAHLIMLYQEEIVDKEKILPILREIEELEKTNFKVLKNQQAERGIYLHYESFLIEKVGLDTGGILQTGRSRNDLNATILLIKLRGELRKIINGLTNLQNTLLIKSKEYCNVLMPAYTHFQPAVPITYGHYLSGINEAIQRDVSGLIALLSQTNICPLGACAVGGTSLPINQGTTSKLLGFDDYSRNSIDAVASRDIILRLLSLLSINGTTIGRIATDYLLWNTAEFKYFNLPDEIVGSSSIMPNKRNPFILEIIQGKTGILPGAFIAAISAMQKTPFTNSIAVGTESKAFLLQSIDGLSTSIELLNLFIEEAIPDKERMKNGVVDRYTLATDYVNQLVTNSSISFRKAHNIIGGLVRQAQNNSTVFENEINMYLATQEEEINLETCPRKILDNTSFGGGPGISNYDRQLDFIAKNNKTINSFYVKWRDAEIHLSQLTNQLIKN